MAALEQREIASIERDPMVPAFQGVLAPTDETLRLRGGGQGYGLYDEIRRDPHAFAVLQKRSLEVVSREWRVQAASDRLRDRKAAEFVETQLKALNFDRLTRGLMGAVLKGFAAGEVMWALKDGLWTVPIVKVRKQRRFRFTVAGELRLITRENGFDGEAVPDRKFIVHRHSIDDDDDDPYGLGLGTVLFWPAWFKRQVLAFWLKASEKFAGPTVLATYQGEYDEARQNQVLSAIRTMQNDAGLVVPESVVVTLLEAQRAGGGDSFEALNRYLDELMSEAVLGETLSTNSGERGARSLGEVHNDVRIAIAKADADLVSATINDTLVRWLVEVNFPGAAPPTVWRDFSEAEDLDKRVQRDKAIVDMGYRPKDVDYINETYGGEWVEKQGTPPTQPQDATGQLGALFAEAAAADPLAPLVDRLEEAAQPAIDTMIARIREAVMAASSYEDLAERLLSLGLAADELAAAIEAAATVAELAGRAEVAG